MSSVYQSCATEYGDEIHDVLQCVSNWIEESTKNQAIQDSGFVAADFVIVTEVNDWLLVLTGALVFFMQAGFAMVCAGAIRRKNINNTVRHRHFIFVWLSHGCETALLTFFACYI
jgi:Ammonium Transporter Family